MRKPGPDSSGAPSSGPAPARRTTDRGPDALAHYRAKRSASRTPEPFGSVPAGRADAWTSLPARFVVQKHAARRLHYDFRLELGGVLKSWAVPRGPCADPGETRLAVEVEDHPLEYADFEGVIPAGNYGAGPVIAWDRGVWTPLGDPRDGTARGKLVFRLQGYKLQGEWTLFRTRGTKEWMLRKHRDGFADPGQRRPYPEESVLSGLLLDEVAAARVREAEILEEAGRLGARRRRLDPRAWRPMLAEQREEPFGGPGWIFELKIDGYRALAAREGRVAALRYRSGADVTARFPEIALALRTLPCERALLDGEIAVLDAEGKPSFQALQGRAQLSRARDVERASLAAPATYFAFDLLAFGDLDLTPLPLSSRKALLARIAPKLGPVRLLEGVEERGEDLWREVGARGLEGMVAKRADAPYRAGRSPAWLKLRRQRSGDFVVVGFTAPGGKGRVGLGALHLAVRDAGALLYAGSVGSGFTDDRLRELRSRLDARRTAAPPCSGPVPGGRGNVWVEPSLVCEVQYHAWTAEGLLRQPVFLRLREDKAVEDCGSEGRPDGEGSASSPARDPIAAPSPASSADAGDGAEERRVTLTHLEKIYFPEDGLTKGDLVEYYRAISPWLLPYLRGRPLTLTRFPDGIHGKSFFQKDAPAWRPAWIRTQPVWSEESGRDLEQYVVDDLPSLLHVVNLGTIPIHVVASHAPDLARPDWCSVDLDPKGAPLAHVARLARALRALCEEIGLPSFVKTTGQAGLHVLVPVGGQCTHEQARQLAGLLARVVADELPELGTLERVVAARRGRVYLDTLQNGAGKTLAAPFCVRPRPGGPVSTPLRWAELGDRLDPGRFTMRSVPRRMSRLRDDPLAPVLALRPDLVGALARLRDRLPVPPSGA